MAKFKKFAKILGEVIFPEKYTCDICGTEIFSGHLCSDCEKTVTYNEGATCPVCGRKTIRPEICLECKALPPMFKLAVSPLVYDGGARILIAKFKNGDGYLKEYFAELITTKLVGFPEIDCIVYVPMTKKAEQKRGYNQAKLLAQSLSARIQKPWIKNALVKEKETAEQKSLNKKERIANLEACFNVSKREEIKGKNILLVDDVLTTGATADAVTKRLLRSGAKRVYLATVVSVEYKQIKDKKKDRQPKIN